MIGNHPDIKDIELDLQALVLPANLVAEESLSPDSEADEEEEQQPYRVCLLYTSPSPRDS